MKALFISIPLLFLLAVQGCNLSPKKQTIAKTADTVKHTQQNAPEPLPAPTDFQAFLQSLIDTSGMQPETDWLKNVESVDMGLTRMPIDTSENGNDYYDTAACIFPFKDIQMSYRVVHFGIENDPQKSCESGSQFTINGYKLPLDKDCQRCYPRITPATVRRYSYKGLRFITMSGGLSDYNGYGDRIQFNYFFDITRKPYTQDIYTNEDGHIYQPLLYGNLDDNNSLDRIVFDGVGYPWCNDTCLVTITAQTYKNKKWQELKDKNRKPYYIQVRTDGDIDSFGIVKYNWMRKLPTRAYNRKTR